MNKQLLKLLLNKWLQLIPGAAEQIVYHKQCEAAQKDKSPLPTKPLSLIFDFIKSIYIIKEKIEENFPEIKNKLLPYDDSIELDFESLFEIYSEHNLMQINKIKKCINLYDRYVV